jgi:hypothetical protein
MLHCPHVGKVSIPDEILPEEFSLFLFELEFVLVGRLVIVSATPGVELGGLA